MTIGKNDVLLTLVLKFSRIIHFQFLIRKLKHLYKYFSHITTMQNPWTDLNRIETLVKKRDYLKVPQKVLWCKSQRAQLGEMLDLKAFV